MRTKGRTIRRLLLSLAVTALIAVPAPGYAISAKSSGASAKKAEKKPAVSKSKRTEKSQEDLLNKLRRDVKSSKDKDSRKSDQFIDKNKDGVDDRVATPKRRTRSTPEAKPGTADKATTPEKPAKKPDDEPKTRRKPPR